MPNVRTQIRGIKDAKKSNKENKASNAVKKSFKKNVKAEANEEKMQVKAAKKFVIGGPMKKKTVKVDNTPSYPSYNEFKDVYRKQGMNSDTTYFRPNPQNIRGIMEHNNVPADSVGVWSSRMNRELSAEAIKNAQKKAANKKSCGGKLKSSGKKFKCGGKMKKKC